MQIKLFISLLFITNSLCAQVKNPYVNLKFDKVIMYDFADGEEKEGVIFNKDGKLVQTIVKQVTLDPATIKKLNYRIGLKQSYGSMFAMCFNPHLGFVYFLKDKIVAQATVCFGCNILESTLDIPAQKQGKQGEGKEVFYMSSGLSKSFRKFLNELVIKNGFSNQIQPGAGFDE
ncbi:MAG: hypothetical protein QM737_21850 [Ferruginibacter sp.]